MVPVVVEPAAVTSFGVFHSSFHPGADLPPQKYVTRPTSESAVSSTLFRSSLQSRALTRALISASLIASALVVVLFSAP